MSYLTLLLLFLSTADQCRARHAFACGPGPAAKLPFCQKTKPTHVRARDLVGRLTTEEKIGMLVNNAAGVRRLGIPGYEWWSEALHGVSNTGPGVKFGGKFPGATSFPQVITTAASFNATLWELIGKVVSDEARAMYNGGRAGLSYWSPNVNIFRDPRWGRGQETAGEDPAVAGRYAAAYVRGLQQPHDGNRLKVAACCKHYTAYDLDKWKGFDRFHFNAKVSKRDLEDTFNVPFHACVEEGKVASIMCSYNQVNGVPTCADRSLLLGTVRRKWNLDGYIVSDCDSVGVLYGMQHYTKSPAKAAALAIKAGLDLDCGNFLAKHTLDALHQNLLTPADVDNALINTVTVQMRLGLYDGEPSSQPFGHLGPIHVCSQANQALALEAARQGVVLLKNVGGSSLPLSSSHHRTVAVIGPNSDATVTMIGNYAGVPCGYTTPVQGIGKFTKTIIHRKGCTNVACRGNNQPFDAAIKAAKTADATVLVMGLDQSMEAESRDRTTLLLPGHQKDLISKVAAASKGPTILVLMCGGPLDVTFANRDPRISAIMWVGYPGQAGGAAIGEAIFGAFNPSGKLPVTWYPEEYVEKVPMTRMDMRPNPSQGYPGRTHRFYDGPVVYPFGYGLSYTAIHHTIALAPTNLLVQLHRRRVEPYLNSSKLLDQGIRVTHAKCEDLSMAIQVDVKNAGEVDGSDTVLVFSVPPSVKNGEPRRQLVAFQKVGVAAKSQVRVKMVIDVCGDLSFADSHGIRRIPLGEHKFEIGKDVHRVTIKAGELGM